MELPYPPTTVQLIDDRTRKAMEKRKQAKEALNDDAPSPRSMRCERLEAEGSVRSLYLWCDARLPNWADSVTWG